MALSIEYVTPKIKTLLNIDDTTIYDDKLGLLIAGAFSKLKNEGVPNVFEEDESEITIDYIICLSYQIANDMDMDIDLNRLLSMYLTRVNTLRIGLNVE